MSEKAITQPDWLPIETAPKDGTEILAYGKAVEGYPSMWRSGTPRVPACLIIRWIEGWYDKDEDAGGGLFRKIRTLGFSYWAPHPHQFSPTHWMPLPLPPANCPVYATAHQEQLRRLLMTTSSSELPCLRDPGTGALEGANTTAFERRCESSPDLE